MCAAPVPETRYTMAPMCAGIFFFPFLFCFTGFAYFSMTRLLSCRTPQDIDNDRVHATREPQAPYINLQY